VAEKQMAELVDGAMKLLSVDTDDLYATLGAQLLGCGLPVRAAGIVTYLSAIRKADQAKSFIEVLRPGLTEWGEGLETIYEELRRDGIRYLMEVSADLKNALCNDRILQLADHVDETNLQIIIMVTGSALKIPSELRSVHVTVVALILKLGLRAFCTE
jgi:hypothetical protein